jgi:hypothetical protein
VQAHVPWRVSAIQRVEVLFHVRDVLIQVLSHVEGGLVRVHVPVGVGPILWQVAPKVHLRQSHTGSPCSLHCGHSDIVVCPSL